MRKIFLSLLVLATISSIAQDLPKNYASLLKEVEPELIS